VQNGRALNDKSEGGERTGSESLEHPTMELLRIDLNSGRQLGFLSLTFRPALLHGLRQAVCPRESFRLDAYSSIVGALPTFLRATL
jgi:hypothetical protein